jgi:hypothetical protein
MKYLVIAMLMTISVSSFADVAKQPAHREQAAHRRTEAKRMMLMRKNHVILTTPRPLPRAPANTTGK